MPKRAASPDKLTIKGLSKEDQGWLREESDRLGCDPENLVRMMIRQRSAPAPLPPQPPRGGYERPHFTPRYSTEELPGEFDPPEAETEPTLNQSEPTLEDVMAIAPSLLDERPAPLRVADVQSYVSPHVFNGTRPIAPARVKVLQDRFARPANVVPYPRGAQDAFTETEFVTINPAVIGSNMMGDGHGNVMRDNLRHFGVKGTVRR